MLKPIASLSVEVVPQAILNCPVSEVVGGHSDVVKDSDEFDAFEGASFTLDSNLEIAVRHYQGYPKNTATIYIDQKVKDVEEISALIRVILSEFGLTEAVLRWERAKNPQQ
jgi:hypothetical protein